MGRTRKEVEISLLAKVDAATIKRSIALLNESSRGFNAVADAEVRLDRANAKAESSLGDLNAATRTNISAIRQRIAAAKLDIQAQQDALGITKKQTDAIEQQTRAVDKLNKEKSSGKGVSAAERAGSISSFTGSISALAGGGSQLGGAFNIISDITQVAEYLPRLQEALTGVKAAGGLAEGGAIAAAGGLGAITAAAVIAAPAVIAAGIVISKFVKDVDKLKTSLDSAIESQTKYYTLIQSGTSESIRSEIEAATQRRNAVLSTLEDLREGYNSLSIEQRALANTFLGTGKQIKELEAELESSTFELDALNRALGSSEVAARDAAASQEALAEIQRKANESVIQRIASEAAFFAKSDDLTRQQYESELERISERRQAIDLELAALKQTDDGSAIFARRIADLARERTTLADQELYLKNNTRLLIIEREKELRSIEAQRGALDKANALRDARLEFNKGVEALEVKTAQDRIKINTDASKQIAAIEAKRLASAKKLASDLLATDLKASEKLQTSIDKVEIEGREQEIALRKQSAERIEDIETRAARERQRIIEDYNDSALDAIQNRDAVALDSAQRTRNRALKDNKRQLDESVKEERRALKERLEEARKSNRDRINDLRMSYQQERADRLTALNERLNDINTSAATETDLIRQRQTEALTNLDTYHNDQLNRLKEGLGNQLAEYNIFYTDLKSKTNTELNALAARWEAYFRQVGQVTPVSGGGGGGSPIPPPQVAANGIRGFRDGTLLVGERGPELLSVRNGAVDVLSNDRTRGVFNSMAGAMRASSNSVVNNSVNMAAGAFQANLSGGDPIRMMAELRRMMRRDFPRILEETLEAALG